MPTGFVPGLTAHFGRSASTAHRGKKFPPHRPSLTRRWRRVGIQRVGGERGPRTVPPPVAPTRHPITATCVHSCAGISLRSRRSSGCRRKGARHGAPAILCSLWIDGGGQQPGYHGCTCESTTPAPSHQLRAGGIPARPRRVARGKMPITRLPGACTEPTGRCARLCQHHFQAKVCPAADLPRSGGDSPLRACSRSPSSPERPCRGPAVWSMSQAEAHVPHRSAIATAQAVLAVRRPPSRDRANRQFQPAQQREEHGPQDAQRNSVVGPPQVGVVAVMECSAPCTRRRQRRGLRAERELPA